MKRKKLMFAGIAILAMLIIILAVVFVSGNGDAKKLRERLDLGQKYLSELEYDQAVAVFTEAIAIDPKSTDAYMGLAEAYIGLGDVEAARKALEEGYTATGDERLRERLEELTESGSGGSGSEAGKQTGDDAPEEQNGTAAIQFPFALTDIRIVGYDLFGFYYDEVAAAVRAAFPSKVIPPNQEDPNAVWHTDGGTWQRYHQRTENYDDEVIFHDGRYLEYFTRITSNSNWHGSLWYDENLGGTNGIGIEMYASTDDPENFKLAKEGLVDFPFLPGISEEEFMEIMQINEIRETAVLTEDGEDWKEYTFLDSSLGKGIYQETSSSDGEIYYHLAFYLEEGASSGFRRRATEPGEFTG
ncbi:MAG: tetratricopeptide repeat protein [Lachnospiraceae bacterium]|nr:tetratricopeptide repeat protein [Lachnospiraceae bacterium]